MPILSRNKSRGQEQALTVLSQPAQMGQPERRVAETLAGRARSAIFETCANPGCGSGWLHLWRSRQAPIFEGGWSCSAACTAALVASAVRREMDGRGLTAESHQHRIPLGLMMLEQGWITSSQLRQAMDAQRAAKSGRLGQWLVRQQGVSEQLVTRALGLQWSCPVLPMEYHDADALAVLVPRLFVDAFSALPLRLAVRFSIWDLRTGWTRFWPWPWSG